METYPKIVPSSVDIRPRISGTNAVGTASKPFSQVNSHSLFVSGIGIYTVSQIPTTGNFPSAPNGSIGLSSDGSGIYYFGNNPVSGVWNQFVTSDASGNYNIVLNDPRLTPTQVVRVQQNPGSGQFASISDALSSILDAAANKPYVVFVEPGDYVEPELNVNPYIHIVGRDQSAVTISPSGVHNVINLSTNSSLSFLTVLDAPSGYYGVDTINPGNYVLLHKVSMDNCDIGMRVFADNGAVDNQVYIEYVDSTNNNGTTAGFHFENQNGGELVVAAENFYVYGDLTNPTYGIHMVGSGLVLQTKASALEGINGSGIGIVVESGASLVAGVLGMSNWATGVYAPNDGSIPNVILNSTPFSNITDYNVYIANSGATGYMIAYTAIDKQYINENNTFFMTYRKDHQITVSQKGGDFTTIADAINYINTNLDPPTADHGYLITVGLGLYSEPQLVVPEFTYIQGDDQYAVRIQPTGNNDVFHIGQNTTLSFLTIQNVPLGYHGLVSTNPGDFTLIHKVAFENCGCAGKVISNSGTANYFYFEYADTTQDNTSAHGFEFISVSGAHLDISCENFHVIGGNSNPQIGIVASGSGLSLSTRASALLGVDGTGKGLEILDGAQVRLPVLGIVNWATGISVPEDSSSQSLRGYAVSFTNNTINISVQASGASGYLTSYTPYLQTDINQASSFFLANKDQNIITVSAKGSDFTSIAAANAAITNAGPTNQYVISVGPGIYFESNIQLQQYTSIVGQDSSATVVYASNPALPLFLGNINTNISNLTMLGCTTSGTYLINWAEGSNDGAMHINNINIGDTWGIASVQPTNGKTIYFAGFGVKLATNVNLGTGFELIGDPGYSGTSQAAIHLQNSLFGSLYPPNKFATLHGSGTVLQLDDVLIQATIPVSGSTGIEFYDSSRVRMYNVSLDGFGTAISNPNLGAPAEIVANPVTILSSTANDISIQRLNTSGSIQGTFSRAKTDIQSNQVTTLAGDPVDFATMSVGDFYVGPTQSQLAEMSQMWREGSTMGLYTSGTLVQLAAASGLVIRVSGGVGYVDDSGVLKKVEWPTQNYSNFDPWDDVYIYVDANGNISKSSSSINGDTSKVFLGRAAADDAKIISVGNIGMQGNHFSNRADEYLRDVFGGIVAEGLVISNPSGMYLDQTAGEYYYSTHKYEPSSKSNFTFAEVYHTTGPSGIVWSGSYNLTGIVDNSQYDAGGSGLTALTAGYYTKHSMWYAGGGDIDLLVYGQTQYSGLTDVQNAAAPTQPPYFKDAIIHLADIIVKQGSGTIVEIEDVRPVPSYKAVSTVGGGGGVTVHNQLLGLLSDDHTQYLLVNGSRAMTGNLDMGTTNSIINVSGVNGVIVEAHESRHLPNGVDPISTAAPSTIDLTNTINSAGVNNSLAKSDHVHATSYVPVNTAGDTMTGNLIVSNANILATGTTGNIGSSTSPFNTIYANRIVESSPTGYVFAYSTGTQTVSIANTFQNITYSHSPAISGWTHTSGNAEFTCQQDGIYEATFTANVNRTATPSVNIELRATLGGAEIAGSQVVTTLVANNTPYETSNQIIFSAVSGNIFRTQLAANGTNGQIAPFGTNATTRPSIRLSIHKL